MPSPEPQVAETQAVARLQPGDLAPDFSWVDLDDVKVELSALRGQRLLLSFFRFGSCPFCNLRVHRLIEAFPQLQSSGLRVVAFFQSSAEVMRRTVGSQRAPFPLLADPEERVYARYAVERSRWGMVRAARRLPDALQAMGRGFVPTEIDGHADLLPADFLIDEAQRIRVAHYGSDIGDHLALEEVFAFAAPKSSA